MAKIKGWGKQFRAGDRVCLMADMTQEGEVASFIWPEGGVGRPKIVVMWGEEGKDAHARSAHTWDELINLYRQLTGPIRVGDRCIWEPHKPHAREPMVITEIRVTLDDEIQIRSKNPLTGIQLWNSLDRVRESCVRWPSKELSAIYEAFPGD